jgi:hypothetical protein
MPLIYSFVSRGTTVLADYTAYRKFQRSCHSGKLFKIQEPAAVCTVFKPNVAEQKMLILDFHYSLCRLLKRVLRVAMPSLPTLAMVTVSRSFLNNALHSLQNVISTPC